jgi:hypothetical protein
MSILENRIFSKKRCFAHLYTKINHPRAETVGRQLYIFKNYLQTGRWVTELFVVNFSVQACVDIAQQQCVFQKRFTKKFTTKALPVCNIFFLNLKLPKTFKQ